MKLLRDLLKTTANQGLDSAREAKERAKRLRRKEKVWEDTESQEHKQQEKTIDDAHRHFDEVMKE
ncbi:hypothetical protein LCGC14_1980770, partial [marine sediment metagenome]